MTGGLLAGVYAIIERSILAGVVGVVLLAAFRVIESPARSPVASSAATAIGRCW